MIALGRRPRWTRDDLPDLVGQTWLVTGATRGIGLATASAAQARGARLVLAVRDAERGRRLAETLGGAQVVELDLSSLASVRRAAESVPEVDVLVNNAGASTPERRETEDGFEWHLGVNALAPFRLTELVRDRVRRRVVIVASVTHRSGRIDFQDPHFRRRPWGRAAAYSQSKLADMLWALELSRRLEADGRGVDVQLAHPGWADTALANPARTELGAAVVRPVAARLANTPEQAALCLLYAATQPLPPASFAGPDGPGELHGCPRLVGRSVAAADPHLARRLWDLAEAETAG